jgi:hypothetical protein
LEKIKIPLRYLKQWVDSSLFQSKMAAACGMHDPGQLAVSCFWREPMRANSSESMPPPLREAGEGTEEIRCCAVGNAFSELLSDR